MLLNVAANTRIGQIAYIFEASLEKYTLLSASDFRFNNWRLALILMKIKGSPMRYRKRLAKQITVYLICVPYLLLILSGCTRRVVDQAFCPVANAGSKDYMDLQPGLRIRVITPIMKSGGYDPEIREERSGNGNIVLRASQDLQGYEVSEYRVEARGDNGVKVTFISAVAHEQDKITKLPHPLLQVFSIPDNFGFLRLLYMTRVSQSNYDTAIIAGSNPHEVAQLTREIQNGSTDACRSDSFHSCTWIPRGVGVQIEQSNCIDLNSLAPRANE